MSATATGKYAACLCKMSERGQTKGIVSDVVGDPEEVWLGSPAPLGSFGICGAPNHRRGS
jgi:hypothetical protein